MATYLLSSKRLGGSIEIEYLNNVLTVVKLNLKQPMNDVQFQLFKDALSQCEDVKAFEDLGFSLTEMMPTNEKIALYCRLYEQKTGLKYKVSPADAGKMKGLKITYDLLVFYFASENFLFKNKYSIGNLTKYYNELCVEFANAGKSKHPNSWSLEYENKLKGKELSDYWAHLRSLGLKPKKGRMGETIDWV